MPLGDVVLLNCHTFHSHGHSHGHNRLLKHTIIIHRVYTYAHMDTELHANKFRICVLMIRQHCPLSKCVGALFYQWFDAYFRNYQNKFILKLHSSMTLHIFKTKRII